MECMGVVSGWVFESGMTKGESWTHYRPTMSWDHTGTRAAATTPLPFFPSPTPLRNNHIDGGRLPAFRLHDLHDPSV